MSTLFRTAYGSGPELVLVHGWGLHGGIWSGVAAALAARFRVTVVDLPGHGRSAGIHAGDIDSFADALAELVPTTASWLGWSLGATVLLRLCARHRQRVDSLVLVGATPCFVRAPDWPWAMEADTLDAFARDLRCSYRSTLQRFLSLQLGGDGDSSALVRQLRAELFRYGEPDPAALEAGLAILRTTDLRAALADLRIRGLVIHGAHDRLVPVAAADSLARSLGAVRRVFPSAGHAPFLSHPDEFLATVEAFLNE